MSSINMHTIRFELRKQVGPYLEKLLSIYKENVISIVLYGSATGDDYVPKKSDVNLLIVLKELKLSHLTAGHKLVAEGQKRKIVAPLFLTEDHIAASKDVFPIEYLEIKENNIVLFGKDIFRTMTIDQQHLKLFCEQELKWKVIRLRQSYLESGLNPNNIRELVSKSMKSLFPVFRTLLRLRSVKPKVDKESIINQISDTFKLDKAIFIEILKDDSRKRKMSNKDITTMFKRYVVELKKLEGIFKKVQKPQNVQRAHSRGGRRR